MIGEPYPPPTSGSHLSLCYRKVSSIYNAPKQRTRPCPRPYRPSNPAPGQCRHLRLRTGPCGYPQPDLSGSATPLTSAWTISDDQAWRSSCAGPCESHQHGWQSSTPPLTPAWTTFSIWVSQNSATVETMPAHDGTPRRSAKPSGHWSRPRPQCTQYRQPLLSRGTPMPLHRHRRTVLTDMQRAGPRLGPHPQCSAGRWQPLPPHRS